MTLMTYQLWLDKSGTPLQQEKTGIRDDRRTCLVAIQAIAKSRGQLRQHEFINEIIAGELARMLRLPVAQGVFVRKENDRWYASFDFNEFAPEKLPEVIPFHAKQIAENKTHEAAGILAFDIWVCNEDRYGRNIAWNAELEEVFIFDQGESLLVGENPITRLKNIGRLRYLGIGDHVLRTFLPSIDALGPWVEKIRSIPEWCIREVVAEAVPLGLRATDGRFVTNFLLERREMMPQLILENIGQFPASRSLFEVDAPQDHHRKQPSSTVPMIISRLNLCGGCKRRLRGVKWRKATP